MSWFKKAYNRGVPLMDDYNKGYRPSSSNYKKDPRSLVNARPEFGGNKRPGYPVGISQDKDVEDTSEHEKIHGKIPGESVLMDQDPPTGEGVNKDEFTDPVDKIPHESKVLDNVDTGPHNMQKGNIFHRIKNKTNIPGIKL